jgi:uncharacterized protein (TIGR02217 family)
MAFFEIEFPRTISFRAVGGPGFSTTVNQGLSGYEQRNKNWAQARAKWQINLITPASFSGSEQDYADLIRSFFLNVSGKADAFRFRDAIDNKFTNEVIATGDGSTLGPFQLVKTYTIGGRSYVKQIKKPIMSAVNDYQGNALTDTVTLTDNGSPISAANYSIDATTGIVTFGSGHAPANTHLIRASGEFHYPARFDSDDLGQQVEESAVRDGRGVTSLSIALVEVRL